MRPRKSLLEKEGDVEYQASQTPQRGGMPGLKDRQHVLSAAPQETVNSLSSSEPDRAGTTFTNSRPWRQQFEATFPTRQTIL